MVAAVIEREAEAAEFIHLGNVTSSQVCANIRANAGRDLPAIGQKKICICASGPSLGDFIEEIRQRQQAGWHVAAMNGSYNFLLAHRIIPDLFFMVDAQGKGKNLPFVQFPDIRTVHVIASQCDPEIFEALRCYQVKLWHVFNYEGAIEALKDTLGDKRVALFPGAANVGQSCLNPILAMGYREWALFGYDGSVREDATHAFKQPQNAGEQIEEFVFPLDAENRVIEGETKTYRATPTMAHGAVEMPGRVTFFRNQGVRIEIRGDGLLPHMVRRNAGADSGTTAANADAFKSIVAPAPKPRRAGRDNGGRLPIVTFKWSGHIHYEAEDVRIWANQVSRFTHEPHELVVITDEPRELSAELSRAVPFTVNDVRILPMWRDQYEHGRDWHRLKLFAEEMADVIGPRFVVMDLDTLICGQIDPLFANDAPFMAWRDPNRDQYCTSLMIMDAGAFPHVWKDFDRNAALRLRQAGLFGGYDQAWLSYILPGQPRWTRDHGVLSFRQDILQGLSLTEGVKTLGGSHWAARGPSEGVKIINFHGRYKPRDADVQAAFPWIKEFYR
jgi:hypothetical protein